MRYTCSHTTLWVICPTRDSASVLENYNDRTHDMAITNLSSMLGLGSTVRVTLVAEVRSICLASGKYLTMYGAAGSLLTTC